MPAEVQEPPPWDMILIYVANIVLPRPHPHSSGQTWGEKKGVVGFLFKEVN